MYITQLEIYLSKPNISWYVCHVHGTGKGYFAHAGNWIALANESELTPSNNCWIKCGN